MGINASLTRYPADVYDEVIAKKMHYPPNNRVPEQIDLCSIERSWQDIHEALRSFGLPLSIALSGDYGYDGGLDNFIVDEEMDHYLGFVSPALVAEIAPQLRGLPFAELAERLSKPNRGMEYLAPKYQDMVDFYTAAESGGDCVFIIVA